MGRLIHQIFIAVLGIFLVVKFVSGVSLVVIPGESSFLGIELTQNWQVFVLIGTILGFINFFIKPILDKITLPLKILTLGLFSLLINMAIIWFMDSLFLELEIPNLSSLFFSTIIIWGTDLLFGPKK